MNLRVPLATALREHRGPGEGKQLLKVTMPGLRLIVKWSKMTDQKLR